MDIRAMAATTMPADRTLKKPTVLVPKIERLARDHPDWSLVLVGPNRLATPCAAADRLLSVMKYVVLVVILAATYRAGELIFRGFDPCYALISRH